MEIFTYTNRKLDSQSDLHTKTKTESETKSHHLRNNI